MFNAQLIDALAIVSLSWLQYHARELRLVRRVGIMLSLKTYSCTFVVGDAMLAFHAAVQEVPRINLYARLIGIDFHANACGRSSGFRCQLRDVTLGVQYPVVVESVT